MEPRQKDELNRLIARLESPLQERDAPAIEKQVRELLFALEALDHQEAPRREQALRRLAKSLLELCNRDESEQNPYRDELKDMGDRILNETDIETLTRYRDQIVDIVVKCDQFERDAQEKWIAQIRELVSQALQLLRDPENEHQELNEQVDEMVRLLENNIDYYTLTHINRKLKYLLDDYHGLLAQGRRERQELLQIISALAEALQSFQVGSHQFTTDINHFLDELKNAKDLKDIHHLRESLIQETRKALEQAQKSTTDSQDLHRRLLESQSRILVLEDELNALRRKLAEAIKAQDLDHLTGLPNRRAFDRQILLAMETFMRYKQPVALAIIDLDHFKRVNDAHGHPVGDAILKEVSSRLRNMLRKIDFLARYGGEEFAGVFPNTTARGAFCVMERIRKSIARTPFVVDALKIPITISIGICEIEPQMEAADWIEQADQALYAAKRNGRNQVIVAGLHSNEPDVSSSAS